MNPKVDQFLDKLTKWKAEMTLLREIVLTSNRLIEDYKWMHPCYTLSGKNVVLIHEFKEYCALLFHKGVLLKDPEGILIQQTENVQSARQLRFTNIDDIRKLEPVIVAYINEAIAIEASGAKVVLKETTDYFVPEEFQQRLDEDSILKRAFESLTPGRQRAYLFYFSQAKQSKTREARIEKYLPNIYRGKGIDD
ncbi:YdeI/OmpD-associated family protein [Flavobacterium sp. WV_118_3]|uniref:YdeI/OmpD-associated family protein n=1 Tax=Flavobacterium sp. WV_118_3 TaxID=3151764 RepID=UPI00321B841F